MLGNIGWYILKARETMHFWREERLLRARFPNALFERDVQVKSSHLLTLGRNVVVQKGTILHCGGMKWSSGRGSIAIGNDSVISPYCVLYGAGGITIGDRFDCGPGCMIFSCHSDYSPGQIGKSPMEHEFDQVAIGNDVVLFAGCIISPGVTIHEGAVVAAGSVVLQDIPARAMYGGSPAKLIRQR